MPKDATKNVDRYKIRGGQLNEFDFHQNQEEFAEQQNPRATNLIPGTPPEARQAKKTTKAAKPAKATKATKSTKATRAKKAPTGASAKKLAARKAAKKVKAAKKK